VAHNVPNARAAFADAAAKTTLVGWCRLDPGWLKAIGLSAWFQRLKLKFSAWYQRLKLKHDEPLSMFALSCNLRPSTLGEEGVSTAAADEAASAAASAAAAAAAEAVVVATSTAAAAAAAASDADREDEDVGSADDVRVAADPRLLTRVLVHMRQGLAPLCDSSLSNSTPAQLEHLIFE